MNETNEKWYVRLLKYEPAVIRGFLLSLFAVLALVGVEWATEDNALTFLNLLVSLAPLLTGILVRPAVTPNNRVAAEEVIAKPGQYEAGEASSLPDETPVDVVVSDSEPDYREDY